MAPAIAVTLPCNQELVMKLDRREWVPAVFNTRALPGKIR